MTRPTDPAMFARGGSESGEQTALFAWAALEGQNVPELKLMFAIPNGGKRDKITGARMKAEGVKPGVPDVFLPIPRGKWHGLFIELKRMGDKEAKRAKGTASGKQLEWKDSLQAQGYGVAICVGWQAATEVIKQYLTVSS